MTRINCLIYEVCVLPFFKCHLSRDFHYENSDESWKCFATNVSVDMGSNFLCCAGFRVRGVFRRRSRVRNRYETRSGSTRRFGNRNTAMSVSDCVESDFTEMNSVESVERISADGRSELAFDSDVSDYLFDGKTINLKGVRILQNQSIFWSLLRTA